MEPTNKPGATQPNTVEVAKGFKVGNHPAGIYLLKVNNKKFLKCFHMSNIFKVNNKDTRTTPKTSSWCLYC